LFEPTKIAANDALYQTFTTAAVSYAYSVYAKADGANFLYLFWADSTNDHGRYFDLDAGTLGNTVGTAVTNSSIASVGDGWYRCTIVFTGTVGSTFPAMLPSTTNATGRASMVGTTPNGILIWGAQLETGSTATDYQRVVTQYDVTEAGVEDCYYLAFDGTDDSLATAAIDFSATDEMSLFAGMTQTTDGTSCVVETSVDSSANNGAFSLFGIAGTDDVQWLSRGTVSTNVRANVGSKPIIAVYSGLSDVSSDALLLRYNGSQVGSSTGDQGTGNYGSYPLYIGSRAGSSNRLNGRIYSLIVRGALTSGDLLTEAEAYVAGKTGVTI